jgi:glyoxylase-like metal-dependent hydrolase (beta-lactamase superfamily II)
MPSMRPLAALLLIATASGCHRALGGVVQPRQSAVALTGGASTSMIYAARTAEGVIVVDLGWSGFRKPLARALSSLDATAADVRWIFITHAHRDHVSAWPALKSATFFLGANEVPLFTGRGKSKAWIPRMADRLKRPRRPAPEEVKLRGISQDTTFIFGSDTLRAYLIPGHTQGSMVYLFHGVLFAGDAVSWSSRTGFGPAKRKYSDNPKGAARNLAGLWDRLPVNAVKYVCTAHARCALFTPQFLKDVKR